MRKAHDEILPDGEGYFGTIDGLQGVWANADTLEACRGRIARSPGRMDRPRPADGTSDTSD